MTRPIKRYSETFKREVVTEYEAGAAIFSLQKKYGITGGHTIQGWIKKYSRQGYRTEVVRIQRAEEAERVKELEKQVKELEQALGKVVLEKLKLESILEVLREDAAEVVKKTDCHHPTIHLESSTRKISSEHGRGLRSIWHQPSSTLPEAVAGR